MGKMTKEQIVKIAAEYAKENKIKNIDIADTLNVSACYLSNAKRDGMNDEMFKSYIEALGGSVETSTTVTLNKKIYKL